MSANPQAEALRQALRDTSVALDAAEASGEPAALSQALAQMSRCHRRLGTLAEAVRYAEHGLQIARSLSAVDASVDALCELGELAFEQAAGLDGEGDAHGAHCLQDAARDHGFEAARMALHSADPQWEITVLLRLSDLFDKLGDHDDAIALQCRAAGLMTRQAIRASEVVAPA
ncbi:MAG TPA: hypothetical protein VIV84_00775, partial [Burkholderiaceae bacterium]